MIMREPVAVEPRVRINVLHQNGCADLDHISDHTFAQLFLDVCQDKALVVIIRTQDQLIVLLVEQEQ